MNKKQTAWEKIRKAFQTLHLWLGLGSGIIIIAICLSGTIYVFNTELTELAAPELYKVKPTGEAKRIPVDHLVANIPESAGKVTAIYVPSDFSRSYRIDVKKEGDKSRNGTGYFVNPYTGDILGTSADKSKIRELMSSMFSLHRWLLLDKIEKPLFNSISNRELGSRITGWATIIFTIACISGLVIWFPKKIRYWKQGLKIKTKANWKRIIHDSHNAPAFYSLIFLLVMGLTGPQWSFEWYRNGLQKTLGTYQPKDTKQNKKLPGVKNNDPGNSASRALPLSEMLLTAEQQFSYKGDYTLRLPEDQSSLLSITRNATGFFAPAAGDKIIVNSATGEISKMELFKNKPFNERISGSIKALHTGSVYGLFTKVLYFLACLVATTLPVSGTIIWINKMRK